MAKLGKDQIHNIHVVHLQILRESRAALGSVIERWNSAIEGSPYLTNEQKEELKYKVYDKHEVDEQVAEQVAEQVENQVEAQKEEILKRLEAKFESLL